MLLQEAKKVLLVASASKACQIDECFIMCLVRYFYILEHQVRFLVLVHSHTDHQHILALLMVSKVMK